MQQVTEEDVLELGYSTVSKSQLYEDDLEVHVDRLDLQERDKETKIELKKQLKKIRRMEEKLKHAQEDEEQYEDEGYDDEEEEGENDDDDDESKEPHKVWSRHYGNNFVCFIVSGDPILSIGYYWYMNIFILLSFIVANYLMIEYIFGHQFIPLTYVSYGITVSQIIAYILLCVINPGIISARVKPLENEVLLCHICQTVSQEDSTRHCKSCNVCIEGYKHHYCCLGRCVGRGNVFFYYCFVTMLPIYTIYFLIVAFTR